MLVLGEGIPDLGEPYGRAGLGNAPSASGFLRETEAAADLETLVVVS